MLKRVSIQNFKSLKDVTLDLQKVNLLIGPNNSGKTNFLKAIQYMLKDNINLLEADFDRLVFTDNRNENIYVNFFFSPEYQNSFGNKFECIVERSNPIQKNKGTLLQDNRTVGSYFNYNSHELKNKIGSGIIHKPDPNQFIKPGIFSADEISLKGDCSNLIQFLFYLITNYKRSYQNIESDLARCIGDIVSISTPPIKVGEESKLGLKFFGRNDEDFWAEDVSEGVLYFLALITIINQPNPPKLLLLEEPEKGIHPRRIREVMDFIFRLSEEKDVQIILTTHNEHVLDEFATRPESVFVFDKDDAGATYVRNLQQDIIEPTNERNRELDLDPVDLTSNLSENWLYGLLGGVPVIP